MRGILLPIDGSESTLRAARYVPGRAAAFRPS